MKKLIKPLAYMLLALVCLFVIGTIAGYVSGYVSGSFGPEGGLVSGMISLTILLVFVGVTVAALIALYKPLRNLFSTALSGEEGERSPLADLLFGDLDDPEQKKIINRVLIASTLHGLLIGLFFTHDSGLGTLLGNDNFLLKLTVVACLAGTVIWLGFEGRNFIRLDPFWADISAWPMACAGLILMMTILFYGLAEKLFGIPHMPVLGYYAIYGISWIVLCVRKAVHLSGGE